MSLSFVLQQQWADFEELAPISLLVFVMFMLQNFSGANAIVSDESVAEVESQNADH